MADKQKVNYWKTFLIGCGFLGSMAVWSIYDPYVTTLLDEKLTLSPFIIDLSAGLTKKFPFLLELMKAQLGEEKAKEAGFTLVPLFIGFIMTFDNIFGVIFQPLFGKLSDRTHSRFGKRRPFVFVFAPLSAMLFVLIPRMQTVPALMLCIIAFVFFMSLWRSPVMSLMPDLTPPHLRSEANSVISITGGLGAFFGLMAGKVLSSIYKHTNSNFQVRESVFVLGAVFVIIGTIVLALFVKEKDSRILTGSAESATDLRSKRKKENEKLTMIKLSGDERKSLLFMMASLFFLFIGTNSITTFFALFAIEVLHKQPEEATFMLAGFLGAGLFGAILAGKWGKKYGRKKVIVGGLCSFIVIFIMFVVVTPFTNENQLTNLIWPVLIIGGMSSMFINVNTLPLVWSIGGIEKVGTFTGYYYTATFSGQVAAPILYGVVRVLTGTYMSLFGFCTIAFILALLCVIRVHHGEAIPDEVIKQVANET